MSDSLNPIFSKIHFENNNQIIDIDEPLDKYDLLSLLFHRESIPLDISNIVTQTRNDKKRYFEDTTVCYKCGEMGHVSRDCTQEDLRNCIYCDIEHKKKPCDFLFCDNCFKLGHTYRYCRERSLIPDLCNRCYGLRHYIFECPKVWRCYKLKNTKIQAELMMSCPLCFSSTHFLDDCEQSERQFTIFTKNYLNYVTISTKTQQNYNKNFKKNAQRPKKQK